ncbi:hypothetical protein [Leptodesmis sp.]|uniref:hypothetical protein n=1 Tax=Leptodesmis sp. TaxID=3100501 RepID=UPI00405345D9
MEKHLHLIASAENLAKEIANFKSFTARTIIDKLQQNPSSYWLEQLRLHKQPYKADQNYQLWQEGSHPQAILSEAMLRQKLEYIHHNPMRRGYVDDPGHWRYSSYRDYAGSSGVLTPWSGELPSWQVLKIAIGIYLECPYPTNFT